MKSFTNISSSGNEDAFRRGTRVPDGDVNLAWVKSPKLSSENNVIILDTSRTVEENRIDYSASTQLMYANSLGILEDANGNQLIEDEYPCIADVFLQDEDFSIIAGNEYTNDDPLPLVHISRYFHLDFEGLAIGTNLESFNSDLVTVVTGAGEPLVSSGGKPLYRVRLTAAYGDTDSGAIDSKSGAYRLWVFLPANLKKDYFLKYNKVELSTAGKIINSVSNYKEILNPISYFNYVPEESDVVDPSNRRKKIYSTKPVTKKITNAGGNAKDVEGYRAYVPRKAIVDPRLYQLTRWRVKCEFTQDYQFSNIDSDSEVVETINVGFITTNDYEESNGAFMFTSLQNSNVNKAEVSFTNPYPSDLLLDQVDAAYWHVNFDRITEAQLLDYDLLVISPNDSVFSCESIINKLDYFVNVCNGTLLVDTNGESSVRDFNITTSAVVDAITGGVGSQDSEQFPVDHATLSVTDEDSPIIQGLNSLGGYNLGDSDLDLLSLKASGVQGRFSHYIASDPPSFTDIISGTRTNGEIKPMLIGKTYSNTSDPRKGKVYFSTLGLPQTCSAFVNANGAVVNDNDDIDAIEVNTGWLSYVNSEYVTSAMKLVYNIALSATENKFIEEGFEDGFSSKWVVVSDWKSTWTIDGSVLSSDERSQNNFVFQPKNPTGDTESVWQRRLSDFNLKQIIDSATAEASKPRLAGASRAYTIEVTNASVEVPTVLGDNSIPRIWTELYSPAFKIPQDFGPHIIKSESFEPEYSSGQYEAISYPAKKYALQAQRTYVIDSGGTEDQVSNYEFKINFKKTTEFNDGTEAVPGETTTTFVDRVLNWKKDGSGIFSDVSAAPWAGAKRGAGLTTFQDKNYYNPNLKNWPYWGEKGIYQLGSRGPTVQFIQAALNQFILFKIITNPSLPEDGYYGSSTAEAVRKLQVARNAIYKDSIVGSETFAIIGFAIKFLQQSLDANQAGSGTELYSVTLPGQSTYKASFKKAVERCDFFNISDGLSTPFVKISWPSGGPSIIRDYFTVIFDKEYELFNVRIKPKMYGNETSCLLTSLHVESATNTLVGWDPATSMMIFPDGKRISNNVYEQIDFAKKSAKQITVGLAQDRPSGYGNSRVFGVEDIQATAKVPVTSTSTIPGTPNTKITKTETLSESKSVTVPAFGTKVVDLQQFVPSFQSEVDSNEDILSIIVEDVSFTFVSQDNPSVTVSVDASGSRLVFETDFQIDGAFSYIQKGVELPGQNEYFSMTPTGIVSAANETGFVSTDEGIKLLCDSDGKPFGIPSLLASSGFVSIDNEISSISSQLELRSLGTEENVVYGFYNYKDKEFINQATGSRNIITDTLVDTIGLDNIYIAVLSKAGSISYLQNLPVNDDRPSITRLWAMPVYGLCYKSNSRIGIDPLPKNLGPMDVWALPIRLGSFDKRTYIRPREEEPLTHWAQAYEDSIVHAFYSVPEAKDGGWSLLYGRPNIDVKDEVPDVVSSTAIRVRQAPILAVTQPYQISSYADPLRPIFKVYTRTSISDPWIEMSFSNIADYDLSEGIIYFKSPLNSSNPNMVKVSYTSSRKVYDFKQYNGSNRINLNPYIFKDESLINKAIYVYIIPEYVYDDAGSLIAESVSSSTLRWTTNSGVFDSLDSAVYNPLAVKLGIVYITNTADIKNLVMVDTRLRGGGVDEHENDAELKQEYGYANNYWDINYGSGEAYQSGGFIIIRLPSELKTRFNDDDTIIRQVIGANIPAGTAYELQDLNGNPWR